MIRFILGMLFAYLIFPLIQCVTSIANAKTQEFSYKVAQNIKKMQSSDEPESQKIPMGFQVADAIGFQVQQEEEDQEGDQY